MDGGLEVLVGLSLDGARLTEVEDLPIGQARVGCGVFGPSGLLRDLELRLGLAPVEASHSVRVARWSARLAALAPHGRFYSQSYAVDAWGTAAELLRWRDLLVEAGWDGAVIKDGGERLAQIAEVETDGDNMPLPGTGDRLRDVAAAIEAGGRPGYVLVRTVESIMLWSNRWRRVFEALSSTACKIESLVVSHLLAEAESDLGRMQRLLLDGAELAKPKGDGSLIFLRGETVWETAHATAGLLRAWQREGSARTVVIRSGDRLPLEIALEQAGLSTQGIDSSSRLRPLLQVLPLALELAFEPKDPYRVLELITLPRGPFNRILASRLADALAEMPGLGSEAWEAAKTDAAELIRKGVLDPEKRSAGTETDANETVTRALGHVAEWIEAPGHPLAGAPREALLVVAQRVQKWLQNRIIRAQKQEEAGDQDEAVLGIAYAHAAALAETLSADPRSTLSLVQVRQLVEAVVGSGGAIVIRDEQAGRIDHVDCAAALLRPRANVVWWGCTEAAAEAPRPLPFSRAERKALDAAGVRLSDPRAQMGESAATWRRAVLAATQRCVLVAPRVEKGEAIVVHPIWDELTARMGGERRDIVRVSLDARAVLHGSSPLLNVPIEVDQQDESLLPASAPEWRLPAKNLDRGDHASASSLETLLGCPLRWVLEHRARLRSGSAVSIPQDHRLYGTLGHRLVELMHKDGAFKLKSDTLRRRAFEILDGILPKEGATLLLPGRRVELGQVREQLAKAVVRLADLLTRSKLEIVDVEKDEAVDWKGRTLRGRLDVVLADKEENDVVLDLKWGRTSYVEKLKTSTAVQLAVYAFLRKTATKEKAFPAVAYFSLSRGTVLATDDATFDGAQVIAGADAQTTWKRTDVTLKLIERHLDEGRVPVSGIVNAPPLVQSCGGEPASDEVLVMSPDAACDYCAFDPVCGRRWEAQR